MNIFAAILIGVGIFVIFQNVTGDKIKELTFRRNMLTGIIFVVLGSYIIISGISSVIVIQKIIGAVLTFFGYFLMFKFPYCPQYNRGFEATGIFFGAIILIVGLVLLIF